MTQDLTHHILSSIGKNYKKTLVLLTLSCVLYLIFTGPDLKPAPTQAVEQQSPAEPLCTAGQLAEQMLLAKKLLAAKQGMQAGDELIPCREQHAAGPDAATYAKAMVQWQLAIDEIVRKEKRTDLARRKREGVSIGMSTQDALNSSWGKPDKINSTTRASGTSEQWVYRSSGSGYLYFDNGVLTSIQN
jgi:hypothetical protein